MVNGKEYSRYQSRKWLLVLVVIILATIGTFAPPLISSWVFASSKPLYLLTGTEWVSVVTLVVSAYFGANVWQKKIENGNFSFSAGVNAEVTTTEVDDKKNKKKTTTTTIISGNEEGEA